MSRKMRVTLTVVVIVALVGSGLLAVRVVTTATVDLLPVARSVTVGDDHPADRQGCRSRYRRRIAFGRMVFPCSKPRPCPRGGDIQRQCRLPVVARRPRGGTEPTWSIGAVVRLPGVRRQSGSPNRGGSGDRRAGRAGVAGGATGRRPEPDRVLRRIPGRGSRSRAWPCTDRLRRWCCGRRSRRWPTSACCTTRGCRCGSC